MSGPVRMTYPGQGVLARWKIPASDPTCPHPLYDVMLLRTGEWTCDCRAGVYYEGLACRHIRACQEMLQAERGHRR